MSTLTLEVPRTELSDVKTVDTICHSSEIDPETFFPVDQNTLELARTYCDVCPAFNRCESYAMDLSKKNEKVSGVYAGALYARGKIVAEPIATQPNY